MECEPFAAYVGIDWADRKHDICLREAGSNKSSFKILPHSAESIEQWAYDLRARFEGQRIAVCLEQSRGPLIAALLKYDFLELYPVNPSTLANYREAFSPSRAKDDPSDAEYLVELLQRHRERLTAWRAEDEHTRKLQYLVEYRRKLVSERTRISNRLTSHLKGYFPQILEWFPDIRTQVACEFLLSWPTPESLKGVHSKTIISLLKQYGSRSPSKNEQRVQAIRELVALTTDSAIIEATSMMVKALSRQMKCLLSSIKELEKEIETLFSSHTDAKLFASLPGAGPALAARLLVAFGTQRDRFKTADSAARYFGIAPVIERSGSSEWIRWRYFCPKFIRQSFHEFANESIRFSFWAEAFYRSQREKGKKHHVAVRALAFKWIRIIFRCWQNNTLYDEATYLKALKKNSSSLLAHAAIKSA